MKINCLIVDDELLARRLLSDYVGKIPGLSLVAACSSAMEAQGILQDQKIDLMFLDIQMPELTGIAFLQSLSQKPVTIFTTAYTEYAIKGYELSVLDYLVKPISFERFFQAVNRASEYINHMQQEPKSGKLPDQNPPVQQAASQDFIFVKSDYKIQKIHYGDIDYIEAYGEYILIFAGKEKVYCHFQGLCGSTAHSLSIFQKSTRFREILFFSKEMKYLLVKRIGRCS